ncbi:MAG: hypothetical protein WC728_08115 [Elusimicrobiota bacterium]
MRDKGQALRNRSLLSWEGPWRHVLCLERAGRRMGLRTLAACIDHAFSTPSKRLTLELAAGRAAGIESLVWFAGAFGRRKAEWGGRVLDVWLRLDELPSRRLMGILEEQGVGLRLVMSLDGKPRRLGLPGRVRLRALCRVEAGASDPSGWADRLSDEPIGSVRLEPGPFGPFFRGALERLLERGTAREEWTQAALARVYGVRAPEDEGSGLLSDLAYGTDGTICAGEGGFELGRAGELRHQDLAGRPIVTACLSAQEGRLHPRCFQCAYKPFCRVPASFCRTNLCRFDALFSLLSRARRRKALEAWLP